MVGRPTSGRRVQLWLPGLQRASFAAIVWTAVRQFEDARSARAVPRED